MKSSGFWGSALHHQKSSSHFHRTALHFACVYGRLPVVHVLLKNNSEIDALDQNQITPLMKVGSGHWFLRKRGVIEGSMPERMLPPWTGRLLMKIVGCLPWIPWADRFLFFVIKYSLSNAGNRSVRLFSWSMVLIRTFGIAAATAPCTMLCTMGMKTWPHYCLNTTLISNKRPKYSSPHFNPNMSEVYVLIVAKLRGGGQRFIFRNLSISWVKIIGKGLNCRRCESNICT